MGQQIFNFTPEHGGWTPLPMQPQQSPLAAMMPEKENNRACSLWKMPSWTAEELGLSVDLAQLVVPITSGLCVKKENVPTVFVCFAVPKDALMLDFVAAVAIATKTKDSTRGSSDEPTLLIRTRKMKLTGGQATTLFSGNSLLAGKAIEAAKSTPGSVMMEFQGPQCFQHVNETLQDAKFASEAATRDVIFVSKDTATALRLGDLVFKQWKIVV